jgi:ABC transporter substrate binding protein (PQQ-dependent alcohol dehydrogenase system)
MRPLAAVILAAAMALPALAAGALAAGNEAASEVAPMPIGYLEITGDERYDQNRSYAGIQVRRRWRPVAGAELAVRGSRVLRRALKLEFSLERGAAETAAELVSVIERLAAERGVRFFLIDAPAEALTAVAEGTRGRELLLFNVSEAADVLRGAQCQAHLMHVIPSHAMLTDALVQYLAAKRWRDVLVLKGPLAEDAALVRAFENSARRFGVRLAGIRDFVLSNDPREREKNNVVLLTQGVDYDAVFLADTEGEFGRYVPMQTALPRPVIGTEGLIAAAWHWSWERHGAPQLNQRFDKHAKRRMQGADWAAWAAVKAIVESVVRTGSTDFAAVGAYLRGDKLTLDGYKGNPASFRPWDNQLRQPILLHTHNAVVERAPLEGFLHPTQNMDTLGYDRGDGMCRF